VRIAELALLGVAELGILLTIVDRVLERELIAIGFVVFNNAAHASMLYALLAIPAGRPALALLRAHARRRGHQAALAPPEPAAAPPADPHGAQAFVVAYAAIYLVALVLWQLAT
jgi:hypothetical protein